jgi:hypothetical protein
VTARLRHAATIADQIAQEGTSLAVRLHDRGDLETFAERLAAATTVLKPSSESTESERLRTALTVMVWLEPPCVENAVAALQRAIGKYDLAVGQALKASSVTDLQTATTYAQRTAEVVDRARSRLRAAERLRASLGSLKHAVDASGEASSASTSAITEAQNAADGLQLHVEVDMAQKAFDRAKAEVVAKIDAENKLTQASTAAPTNTALKTELAKAAQERADAQLAESAANTLLNTKQANLATAPPKPANLEMSKPGTTTTLTQIAAPSGTTAQCSGLSDPLARLLDAALQRDLVRMAPALAELLGKTQSKEKEFQRALTLVSALGAHLSSPADGAKLSEEEKAARRDARKASIKSLLEMQTLRGQRKGDWIVSVGGHVGGQFAWSRQTTGVPEEEPSTSFASQPLTARLGFALDGHCRDSVVGFHAEVMPIDLGAFVNLQTKEKSGVEEVDPAALLQPSFSAGPSFLFSDESDVFFFVGATVGVDPGFGSGATEDTRVFVGGSLGVFVPLVDLN